VLPSCGWISIPGPEENRGYLVVNIVRTACPDADDERR
jgi:hypothetical protein